MLYLRRLAAVATSCLIFAVAHSAPTSAIAEDPAPDSAHPASMVEIAVPSHGANLLGALYLAAGDRPHPIVVLLHGFPGYEQNMDLAQVLRRVGYHVLAVHYRGSWGVGGGFSFAHAIEDADAQVDWVASPQVASKYHIDTTHIVVIGHSMGGLTALEATAHHPKVVAAVSISGASMVRDFRDWKPERRAEAVTAFAKDVDPADLLPLTGTSAQKLGAEAFDHRAAWDFANIAPALGMRPVLLITAADGSGPTSAELLKTLEAAGNTHSRHIEMKTDHPFSDHRIALEQTIVEWLGQQVH